MAVSPSGGSPVEPVAPVAPVEPVAPQPAGPTPITPTPAAPVPAVTVPAPPSPTGPARRSWRGWRRGWRGWRRSRPFWGGLLLVVAGAEILVSVRAPLPVVLHVGPLGLAGYLVPTIMVLCGLLLWFNPGQRLFYSIIGVLMALTSWLTSNLGGFFLGLLLGLIGGSLAFAWAPGRRARTDPGHDTP